jgi:excisionase family DNA binding protein
MSETRVAPPQTEQTGHEAGVIGWLTLQEASELLSVAPSTVRRWADAGRISTRRTAGGHRRFEATAVHALRPRAAEVPESVALAPSAERIARQPWHPRFADASVAGAMRTLGQRLLGLLIQYLIWQGDNERFLDDGRQIGAEYGRVARDAGIPMRETMQAFLFFRRTFWRTALQAPAVAQVSDVAEVMRIAERIDHFMNEVLFSTLSAYE